MCRYDIRDYTRNDVSNNSIPIPPPPSHSTQSPNTPPSPPPPLSPTSLPPPPNIPAPTHNAETQVIRDPSFNDLVGIFQNLTNVTNIDNLTENFFSNLIQNMPLTELNNLSSINVDISGNTASLSFEGNIPPPPNDVD
jgi:hypothetical protein